MVTGHVSKLFITHFTTVGTSYIKHAYPSRAKAVWQSCNSSCAFKRQGHVCFLSASSLFCMKKGYCFHDWTRSPPAYSFCNHIFHAYSTCIYHTVMEHECFQTFRHKIASDIPQPDFLDCKKLPLRYLLAICIPLLWGMRTVAKFCESLAVVSSSFGNLLALSPLCEDDTLFLSWHDND